MTLFVFFSICHHFCNLEASTWDIGSRNLKFPQTRPVNFCDNWGSRCRWLDAISFTSPLACSSLIAAHVRASSLSIQTKFTFRGKTPLVYRIRALFPCTRSVWLTVFLLMCSLLRPSIGLNDSDGWAGECEMSTFLSGRCYKCVFSVFGVWCFARSFLSLHLRFPRPQVMAAIFTPPISVQTDAEMRKLVVYVSSIAIGMCLLTTVVHCVEHTTAHNANKFAQCLKCRWSKILIMIKLTWSFCEIF